jgi:pre-mRNA-processing factor 40
VAVNKPPLVFASKAEAKEAFKAMLTDVGVKTDQTWEATMRAIISEDRYGALKSLGEKKSCFNEWVQSTLKQEKENKRLKAKQVCGEYSS